MASHRHRHASEVAAAARYATIRLKVIRWVLANGKKNMPAIRMPFAKFSGAQEDAAGDRPLIFRTVSTELKILQIKAFKI